MYRQNILSSSTALALLWLVMLRPAAATTINDFNSWMQVQDPPHSGMTGSIDNPGQVTLTATGAVPAGTDIGYQSVNGSNVASSTAGSYFSASQDFHIAIDFSLSSLSSTGFAAIGFGIGEDSAGTNSAGALLAMVNGGAPIFSGAARSNDISDTQLFPGLSLTPSGRFFVRYDSLSGDIIYGINTSPGAATPIHTGTFSGRQKSWNGDDLLVSFFLRSDDPAIFSSLTSGTVSAVFSNFEVLEGAPMPVVPLPAAFWLFGFGLAGLIGVARRKTHV